MSELTTVVVAAKRTFYDREIDHVRAARSVGKLPDRSRLLLAHRFDLTQR